MSTQLSKRELSIRVAGIGMLVSPIFNILNNIILSTGVPNKWSWAGIKLILSHNTTANWILYAASMVIGSMMVKGRRASWAFLLIVLGIYIFYSSFTLAQDIRAKSVQAILAMLVNCGIFVLIYLQEFHQQVYGFAAKGANHPLQHPEPPKGASHPLQDDRHPERSEGSPVVPFNPPTLVREKEVELYLPLPVSFDGLGTWAQLVSISATELRMKGMTKQMPDGLHYQTIELDLPSHPEPITVRARLFSHNSHDYIFKIVS